MFCYRCGTELPDDSVFCGTCGERLHGEGRKPGTDRETSRANREMDFGSDKPGTYGSARSEYPSGSDQAPPSQTGWDSSSGARDMQPGTWSQTRYVDAGDEFNQHVRPERDRFGFKIPAEYPPYFDRNGWCWPGFWFPAYWCCIKGIYNQAWKYILVKLLSGLVASIWCGLVGYREYSDFINRHTPEEITRHKGTGMGCFISLIVTGVVAIILYFVFLVVLMSEMGSY